MPKHPLSKADLNLVLAMVALGAAAGFVTQAWADLADARRDTRRLRGRLAMADERAEGLSRSLAQLGRYVDSVRAIVDAPEPGGAA